MKISIKTIKGEVFPVEIEPSNTILDLKKKIEGIKNMEVSTLKLILKGANTNDENTLESYGVKEGDFLVVMQTKKLNTQTQAQPQQQNPNPVPGQPQPLQTQPKPNPTTGQSQPGQPADNNSNVVQDFSQASASNVVLGDKFNQTVEEICKMGFPKEDTIKALKAAFNNPDRAIDYLINGIPEIPADHHQPPAHQQPAHNPAQQPAHQPAQGAGLGLAGQLGVGGGQNAGGSEAFLQLLNNPQFQLVRNLIRQRPEMLQGILMQLQQSNPELFSLISQNQDAFTRWLTEGGAGGVGGGTNVVHVSPEEKEAIDRLIALGFEKQAVIQAYLVCDKNEELAANFLFDQMNQGDFDDVQQPAGTGAGVQGLPQQPVAQPQPQPPAQQQPPVQLQPPAQQPEGQQAGGEQPAQGNVEQKKEEEKPEGEKKMELEKEPDNKDKKDKDGDDDTIFS